MPRQRGRTSAVLQDTLLAAARTLPTFRGDAAVGTWLFTIARSFCIKRRRRRGREAQRVPLGQARDGNQPEEMDACNVADAAAPPDEAAMNSQIGRALEQAIQSLAPTSREVLLLRDVEGLTAPEVAAALGIRVDAVKSRLHRARSAVREHLAPLLDPHLVDTKAVASECPDIVRMYSRKLEGEVGPDLCAELEQHVSGCERCSAACDTLRRTLSLCQASRGARVPPRIQDEVRKAVREVVRVRE